MPCSGYTNWESSSVTPVCVTARVSPSRSSTRRNLPAPASCPFVPDVKVEDLNVVISLAGIRRFLSASDSRFVELASYSRGVRALRQDPVESLI
ncbi:hypothetical protein L3X38_003950 [Prunus dulcis]|uniref:Uncharacterized protein n=1 Tax=Prunus dulcis TaxID=3755 RepID=A0AAD4ZN14_PRUDU|nr:hypothetical protein L3X38_003950 [Prunus dulcis]